MKPQICQVLLLETWHLHPVLNRQRGMALISVTYQWLSRTHAVSVIAMRQSVQLRAMNSQVMLFCGPTGTRNHLSELALVSKR